MSAKRSGNVHPLRYAASMARREIGVSEAREIGEVLGDPFVALGHPLTCNGGNPDWRTHHDHEVLMLIDGDRLVCPECGRLQPLG
jgi:hypothetical protein